MLPLNTLGKDPSLPLPNVWWLLGILAGLRSVAALLPSLPVSSQSPLLCGYICMSSPLLTLRPTATQKSVRLQIHTYLELQNVTLFVISLCRCNYLS